MKVASVAGQVRAFTKDDIPQVADLHRRVTRSADQASPELLDSYRTYFAEIFLNDAWRDNDTESLVYEEAGGRITGFFGAVARRMSFKGRAIRVKIGSQAVVDPGSRGVAGLKLYSAFLDGPQDLFIGDEANSSIRPLWEGFGGSTSFLYSMCWLYPLRPGQFARAVLTGKKLLPPLSPRHSRPLLARISAPVAWALDAFFVPRMKKLSGSSKCRVFGEELTCATLLHCLAYYDGGQSLRPVYDEQSLNWILRRAEELRRNGRLQKILVKTEEQDIAGWYIYYAKPGAISQVVQLYAKPSFANAVLDHLFHHAESQGAAAVGGRMEPSLMQAFSERHCLFHCGPAWALVYSPRPDLLHALDQGDALFSRLEGEWCLHFR
jgi:hypothetical protein